MKILKNIRAHVEHSTDKEETDAQLTYFTNLLEATTMLIREVDINVTDTNARKDKEVKPAEEGVEADPVCTRRKEDLPLLNQVGQYFLYFLLTSGEGG